MRAVRPPRWSHRLSVRSTVKTVHPKGPSFFFLFPPLLFLALLLCGSSRQILSVRFRNAADRKLSAAVSFFLVFFFCFRSDFLLLLLLQKKENQEKSQWDRHLPAGSPLLSDLPPSKRENRSVDGAATELRVDTCLRRRFNCH